MSVVGVVHPVVWATAVADRVVVVAAYDSVLRVGTQPQRQFPQLNADGQSALRQKDSAQRWQFPQSHGCGASDDFDERGRVWPQHLPLVRESHLARGGHTTHPSADAGDTPDNLRHDVVGDLFLLLFLDVAVWVVDTDKYTMVENQMEEAMLVVPHILDGYGYARTPMWVQVAVFVLVQNSNMWLSYFYLNCAISQAPTEGR